MFHLQFVTTQFTPPTTARINLIACNSPTADNDLHLHCRRKCLRAASKSFSSINRKITSQYNVIDHRTSSAPRTSILRYLKRVYSSKEKTVALEKARPERRTERGNKTRGEMK